MPQRAINYAANGQRQSVIKDSYKLCPGGCLSLNIQMQMYVSI